jgi:hypothetical protein
MNEVLAAPDSGLPFLPIAFCAQPDPALAPPFASASQYLTKEGLAASASGFPALLIALDSQSDHQQPSHPKVPQIGQRWSSKGFAL